MFYQSMNTHITNEWVQGKLNRMKKPKAGVRFYTKFRNTIQVRARTGTF